jgi:hypothetical protein
MKFTANPGTWFWSNGSAWGTCSIKDKTAELTVLHGSLALDNFTIEGAGTKKLKSVNLKTSESLKIEVGN